jgi:hypothetical protein
MEVDASVIFALFNVFAPIVQAVIADHKKEHAGAEPTEPEMLARLQSNGAYYLGEGAAWRAQHPKA